MLFSACRIVKLLMLRARLLPLLRFTHKFAHRLGKGKRELCPVTIMMHRVWWRCRNSTRAHAAVIHGCRGLGLLLHVVVLQLGRDGRAALAPDCQR
jgi:hypothetical protein